MTTSGAPDRTTEACLEIARERVTVPIDELTGLAGTRLGLDEDAVTMVLDDLLEDPAGPLSMVYPDLVVHVPALADGIVLTHRLSAVELEEDHIDLATDLAGFIRFPDPRLDGRSLRAEGHYWFTEQFAAQPDDTLLAVRVTGDGDVTITLLGEEPVAPPGLVAALRAAYDIAVAEPGLPVSAEDLVVGMLHADRTAFAQPRPPLSELAAAAGLEQRADEFAHDESVWEAAADADRHFRLMDRLGAGEESIAAMETIDLLVEQSGDPAALRRALDGLSQPNVLAAVVEELFGPEEEPERVAAVGALADRLLAAAGRTPRAAVAGWIATVAAERDGRVLDAESHLRAASLATDGWPFVEDRLAWYESDRGDAPAALGRWRSIETPEDDPDVAVLRPYSLAAGPEPGRNQPCWCGSGRKYKQCHAGTTVTAPLPERVPWICRKAVAYLERRGGAAEEAVMFHAEARAGETGDLDAAFADPLVVDTVLHEGGWFERFLADRGPLLPADEALLAASWLLVDRTIYEVTETRPGEGLTVRDVRTGDVVDVAERTAGAEVAVGGRLCARAVPDGAGHQFVGAVLTVPPGRERELLEILDEGDELELLEWVADLQHPEFDVEIEEVPIPPGAGPAGRALSPAVEHLRSVRERRWCDEPVPALGDVTPREAAADPTRRDDLLRLIDSFPEIDPATGAFGLRPARLRELLDLA